MSRVYWDSMLFVYLLEHNPVHTPQVLQIHQGMLQRQDTLCTSIFTIGELLTGPRKTGDLPGIEAITNFFLSGRVEVLPFNLQVTESYSTVRATCRVTQADAIHIATASAAGVDLFITNDKKLWSLAIPGIKFIVNLESQVYPTIDHN